MGFKPWSVCTLDNEQIGGDWAENVGTFLSLVLFRSLWQSSNHGTESGTEEPI